MNLSVCKTLRQSETSNFLIQNNAFFALSHIRFNSVGEKSGRLKQDSDLNLSKSKGYVSSKIYRKRNDFDFAIFFYFRVFRR